MSTGVLAAIIGGTVVVLTIVVVIAVFGLQLVGGAVTAITTGPPLVKGEDAQPLAREPLECIELCFTEASVGMATSSVASYRRLGLTSTTEPRGYYDSTTAVEEFGYIKVDWVRENLEPEECFFTYFGTPVALPFDARPKDDHYDYIEYTGTQTNDSQLSTIWQSVRIFDSSASAQEHMTSLDEQTHSCTHFSGAEFAPSTITPAPALTLPDSVAAIGWIEVSQGWRYYVFDVQRGNLVVRSILTTPVDEVSEQQFRSFVEELAVDVAAIHYTATSAPVAP